MKGVDVSVYMDAKKAALLNDDAVQAKPEAVREKIVDGQLKKWYREVCLLEQPYIRDSSGKEKVRDMLTAAIAKTGENIVIRRFSRFRVGEE